MKTNEKKRASLGKIYPENTMFLRMAAGTAKTEDGQEYEFSTNIGGGNPIIYSKQSGKWWSATWQDLIDLAIEMGLDEKEPSR